MGLFNRKQEIRADPKEERATDAEVNATLLTALLGAPSTTKEVALQIPTVSSAISLISDIIASTPIKLYKLDGNKAEEVKEDARTTLLNDDTGDTLNANQFWKAIISDYYLGKGGYAYINKEQGEYASLHFVDETCVSVQKNTDPIFKDYDILVNGNRYKPYDFFKILRNSKDGAQGIGITIENSQIIEVAYESLKFESNLVKKGGNKKGFLKSAKRLTEIAMDALRAAWKNLYSNNSENMVILNDGLEFIESSNTSVEMQLNENKTANSNELCKIFHISPEVIAGKATESDISSLAKLAAIPLMKTIECALNRDFLLEKEKKLFYWAFDTKELLKGNFKDRMEGYKAAIDSKMMTPNQGRFMEDWENIDGLDIIPMGLADVIFDINTKTYFTPNTKSVTNTGTGATTPASGDGALPTDEIITSGEVNAAAKEVVGKTLNGAQTQSLISVIQQYQTGTLTLTQAVNIIAISIGITRGEAQELIGEAKGGE